MSKVYTKVVWQWQDGILVPIEELWYDYEGPVALAAGTPSLRQEHYRVRSDTTAANSSGTPSWQTTEDVANTPTSALSWRRDRTFRIRFTVANIGTAGINNDDLEIHFSRNSGALTEATSTSSYCILDANASTMATTLYTTGATQLLSNGTGTWAAYQGYADDSVFGAQVDQPDNGEFCEFEFGLRMIRSTVSIGDTFDFYIREAGVDLTGGYLKVPRITAASVVPGQVTGLTATAVAFDQIDLSWSAPADDGGADITGYKIERESPIGGGWGTLVSDTGTTDTNYSDESCSEQTQYNYRVSAINVSGAGTASTADDATTPLAETFNPTSIQLVPPYF